MRAHPRIDRLSRVFLVFGGAVAVAACAGGGTVDSGQGGIGMGGSSSAEKGSSTGGSKGSHTSTGHGGANSGSGGSKGKSASTGKGTSTTKTGSTSGGGACDEMPCRLAAPQCGCPTHQECNLDANGARACTSAGNAGEGDACGSSVGCKAGLVCLGTASSSYSCRRFCEKDTDCTSGLCALSLADASGMPLPGVLVCGEKCDPIAQTGCSSSPGTACQLEQQQSGMTRFFTTCNPPGKGAVGSTCSTSNDCAAGSWCLSATVGTTCQTICDVDGSACPAGQTCVEADDANDNPAKVGGVTYGGCQD